MTDSSLTASSMPTPLKKDARTIALVGLAHGLSHFFHMLLPPLFPLFIQDFGFSYSQLGLLVTIFFVVSGVGQAAAGFVVDRIGARPVLFAGLSCFVLAALVTATAGGYAALMLAAALAGLGNSPFHPVDFTILNKRVSPPNLGHAYSVHGVSGNIGWGAAPVVLAGLSIALGSWRYAAASAALLALLALGLIWVNRDALDDRAQARAAGRESGATQAAAGPEHPLAFLRLPSVWLCFLFFFFSTCALSAIQSFASPALQQMYGLPLSVTAFVVTGYMLFGAVGMVLGGFLAARAARLELIIGVCLMAAAALLALAATGVLPGMLAAFVAAAAGFGAGFAGPSRDMLIRRAAPPGAIGRVYGTVYSGLDLGFALAAPIFGAVLDHGSPAGVFYGAALMLCVGVASAALVGASVSRSARAVAPA